MQLYRHGVVILHVIHGLKYFPGLPKKKEKYSLTICTISIYNYFSYI